jgi:hypothetical protein
MIVGRSVGGFPLFYDSNKIAYIPQSLRWLVIAGRPLRLVSSFEDHDRLF